MKKIKLLIITGIGILLYSGVPVSAEVAIHGFVSQGYMQTSDDKEYMVYGTKDGTFEFNEIGIHFATEVSDDLRMGIQFLAYDLGQLGNDEIIVDWAYADYNFRSYLGFRAGILKNPYGLYNMQRDVDFLRTTIFLPQSVYGEYFRDAFSRIKGIGFYGALPIGFYYRCVVGLPSGVTPEGGLAQTFKEVLGIDPETVDAHYSHTWNLQWRLPWHPFDINSIKLGTSYYAAEGFEVTGTVGESEIRWPFKTVDAFVSSAEIIYRKFILSAEYLTGYVGFRTLIEDEYVGSLFDVDYERYYASVDYRFTSWLEACLFYSVSWYDKNDKSGRKSHENGQIKVESDAWEKDWCFALRFDLNENWLVKMEAHKINGTLHVVGDHENDPDDWFFYAAKVTFYF